MTPAQYSPVLEVPDGSPYGYLKALPQTLGCPAAFIFATNAGMFDPAFKPVGLYIEGGRTSSTPNTKSAQLSPEAERRILCRRQQGGCA
jgi:uncharacterized protein YigE (DUF2233 family)